MKLGIVGKGGVGKTTISALLAQSFSDRGRRVMAVDTDSNPNLGMSLGLTFDEVEQVPVLPRALIVGTGGDMTVDELIERYGTPTPTGPLLLSGIRVTEAGGGCTCSGHATVRNLLAEVLEVVADVTIVDMEAGLEHLSRSGGTLAYADALLVICEPSRKSVITGARTKALADELGIGKTYALGNKARADGDEEFLRKTAAEYDLPLVGVLPFTEAVRDADRAGTQVSQPAPELRAALSLVVDMLEAEFAASVA